MLRNQQKAQALELHAPEREVNPAIGARLSLAAAGWLGHGP